MAEQRAQDVVNQTLSVGDLSPSDAPETTSTPAIKLSGDDSSVVETVPKEKENGIHMPFRMDEIDDASARSDTDTSHTSRAEGSITGDKTTEHKPLKKVVAKPVSFAKYSVPKVIAANSTAKGADKGMVPSFASCPLVTQLTLRQATPPNSLPSSMPLAGRPRLVAKTTSSLQSNAKPSKTPTPDPMQVWNKNRGMFAQPACGYVYVSICPNMLTLATSHTAALDETFDRRRA